MTYGKRFRILRNAAGLSQPEVARRMGLKSHSDISRVENDHTCPTLHWAQRYLDVCGARWSDLDRETEYVVFASLRAEILQLRGEKDKARKALARMERTARGVLELKDSD